MMSWFKSLKIKFRVVGLFSAEIEKIDASTQPGALEGEVVDSTAIEIERVQPQLAKHNIEDLLSRQNRIEPEQK